MIGLQYIKHQSCHPVFNRQLSRKLLSFQEIHKNVRNTTHGRVEDKVLTKVDSDNYCGQGKISRTGTRALLGYAVLLPAPASIWSEAFKAAILKASE